MLHWFLHACIGFMHLFFLHACLGFMHLFFCMHVLVLCICFCMHVLVLCIYFCMHVLALCVVFFFCMHVLVLCICLFAWVHTCAWSAACNHSFKVCVGCKRKWFGLVFFGFYCCFFFAFLFVFWYFYPLLLAAANNSAGNSQGNGAIDENRLRQHTIFSSRDSANGKNKRALKKGTAAIPLFVCLSTVHPLYPF